MPSGPTAPYPHPLHRDEGEGPAVVLLHGFPDTAAGWDTIADRLVAEGYRVVVPHLRGYHPDTIDPARGYGARELATDALAVLDALDLDDAVLVGHDWGAVLAYGAASLAPERLRGLVAIAIPHPRTLRPSPRVAWSARHFLTLRLPWSAAFVRARGFRHVETIYQRWAPDWEGPARDACVAAVKRAFGDPRVLDAALGYYRALTPVIPRELLRRIDVPALLVGSTHDLLPGSAFDRSDTVLTGPLTVEILKGAGHWPHREREERFVDLLLAFLADLPA